MYKILKIIQIVAMLLIPVAIIVACNTQYVYNQEHIVCNPERCVIEHIALPSHEVKKTDKFSVKKIERFEAKSDNGISYSLYAEYKNGTSKKISPVRISCLHRSFIAEPVKYLNEAIKKEPLNIDLYFPNNAYFPEYGY